MWRGSWRCFSPDGLKIKVADVLKKILKIGLLFHYCVCVRERERTVVCFVILVASMNDTFYAWKEPGRLKRCLDPILKKTGGTLYAFL